MGGCCMKTESKTGYDFVGGTRSTPKLLSTPSVNVEDFIIKKVVGRGTFGKVFMVRK
jgi:hypothetical protein